ncbi:MAG TPA: response regulator [Candidatus Desulfofervidus auxilii]|uniref:Response regulator n=1 Tax=Desulfofervidus auxilii TaxID=1621989 RepID=A0A7V1N2M7_DESA2|nr:response regulator [Candidatus Desulfofervidus auxilii]
MRILVVDDFASMRKIIKGLLKQIGFQNIEEADDGSTALEKLKIGEFDLVICDWNMPEVPGIEVLKAVRNDPRLKDLPFLMVTAEAKKDNVMEAVKAGVNQYIVKPFTAETLKKKIEKIFDEG